MVKAAPFKDIHPADWSGQLPDSQWKIYEAVMDAAALEGIPFALGGAFALATYTGRWRNTKDLDLYILPCYRDRIIELTTRLGLADYFDTSPYDRQWIYRSSSDGVIVDIIWAMANHRAQVDDLWMSGPVVQLRGRPVKVVPAEAMVWDKIYIMQRERCDWPDLMNLLFSQGENLNWEEVLKRVQADIPLLAGALSVFRWISPGVARRFPEWLWECVQLPPVEGRRLPDVKRKHAAFLDTRPWYANQRAVPPAA